MGRKLPWVQPSPEAAMLSRFPRALLARWLSLHARRRSMSFLLHREDDRLIEGVGLTREDLHHQLGTVAPPAPSERAARGPPISLFSKYAGGARR